MGRANGVAGGQATIVTVARPLPEGGFRQRKGHR